jgi:ABC-type lipoprotein release transport system permease subunit
MGSVWLSLRADLRSRWPSLIGLALLLGLVCGVVLAAAAGARRTDTAYPRLLRWANAAQVNVLNGPRLTRYDAALARLPQVASASTASVYNTALPARRGLPQTVVETFASPGQALGVSADRVKILQGRMFNPRAVGQAMIDQQLAGLEHLRPGGTLHLLVIPDNPTTGNPEPRRAVPLAFRVSAVVAFDSQIVPATKTNSEPMALLGSPFTRMRLARLSSEGIQTGLRLRPGASMANFLAAAAALAKRHHVPAGAFNIVNLSDEFTTTERAIRPEAIALAAFAALLALIALTTIGQLLSRQLILDAAEFPILRALGMTRARLAVLSLVRVAAVTIAGAAIAVAVAIAASPLMPIGPARLAEPSPGVEINVTILGAGFAGIALIPLAVLIPAAWRAAARAGGPLGVAESPAPAHASRLGRLLGLAGSVTGSVGVRMAFEPGGGRTAVPVRSALVGITVAVGAVVAALVFGASLISLVSTPHRYGQDWAQELDLGFGGVPAAFGAKVLSREPTVTGFAAGNYGQVRVNGENVAAIGIDPVRGPGYFTLLAGRAPAAPDEIVLGAQTMRAVHRQLGQTVRVVVSLVNSRPVHQATARTMRIVGVAVFASFSRGTFSGTDLGNGAAVPASLLSEPFQQAGCGIRSTCYNFFLVRYRAGTDQHAAAARLNAAATAAGCPPQACLVTTDQRPSDIRNYAGVRDTPLILGAVLALLAVGTLTNVLLTGVRRRRRDLAVLQTLGVTRTQVIRMVSWQASALAVAALLAGLPLGVLAGRWSWDLFAGSAGVAPQAEVPVPLVLLTIPAALLLANLIAAIPGWAAAKSRLGPLLRNE